MSIRLILQGLGKHNHLDEITSVLSLPNLKLAIVSVAFMRNAGVHNIRNLLEANRKKILVVAGIRNGITSAQAVRTLLDIGIKVRLVDTGSISRIFHPKIYYAENKDGARLLVGSANLTAGGLSTNLEASVLTELDFSIPADRNTGTFLIEAFEKLSDEHPSNVADIAPNTSLEDLLSDARLMDEAVSHVPKAPNGPGKNNFVTPPLKFKSKKLASAPNAKRTKASAAPASQNPLTKPYAAPTPSGIYEKMWSMEGLTRRDLLVPKGKTTNKTGSINLDQGDLKGDYEWATYFRKVVFQDLDWSAPDARRNQKATGAFRLVIAGVDYGEFPLRVAHDTKTNTKSYRQKNTMTRLSWGPAQSLVARPELIGRNLILSRLVSQTDRFMIEID